MDDEHSSSDVINLSELQDHSFEIVITEEIENALRQMYGDVNNGGEEIEEINDGDLFIQENNVEINEHGHVEDINNGVQNVNIININGGAFQYDTEKQVVDADSDELKKDGRQAVDINVGGDEDFEVNNGFEVNNSGDEVVGTKFFVEGKSFMLNSVEELKEVLEDYYEKTESRFIGWRKTKNFGLLSSECSLSGHQVQWCETVRNTNNGLDNLVPFDGIPYMIVGHYDLDCQFGIDRNTSVKAKRQQMKKSGLLMTKTHHFTQPTKRCGCPAKIRIKQIIRFPEFKIEKDSAWRKKNVSAKLKAKLKECRDEVKTEVCIVGRLPAVSQHKYHETSKAVEAVLQELIILGQELYLEETPYTEIQQMLQKHVVEEMYWNKKPPDKSRRRFYPTVKDIRYFCTRSLPLLRFTGDEQESIRKVISEIQSQGNANVTFLLTGENNCGVEETEKKRNDEDKHQSFIFCNQTDSQRRLLKRYNNVAYLIEVESNIPLKNALTFRMYVIIVQTNIDYQVVGCMIISKQRKDGLVDALRLFREWNPTWGPRYFIVDCLQVIYDALSVVFPECQFFLNPQSCEKNWLEYFTKPCSNMFEHTEEMLNYLKNMQHSLTEESLSVAAALLEASKIWQSRDNLREWFQNNWLPFAKHWVFGYRPGDLVVLQHLNSTVDECISMYKDVLGQSTRFKGFIEMIKEVGGNIPTTEYDKYTKRNKTAYIFYKSYKKTTKLPGYLKGIPTSLLPYIEGLCKMAESTSLMITRDNYDSFDAKYTQPDLREAHVSLNECEKGEDVNEVNEQTCFEISQNNIEVHKEICETEFGRVEYPSAIPPGDHTISFGDSYSHPYCTCSYWLLYRLPCVHMLSVFYTIPGWKYNMLSPLYTANPILEIDYSAIKFPIDNLAISFVCNKECQTEITSGVPMATQTTVEDGLSLEDNVFEIPSKIWDYFSAVSQTKDFLKYLDKLSFLFKYKTVYDKFRRQVEKVIVKLEDCLLNNKRRKVDMTSKNIVTLRTTAEQNILKSSLDLKNIKRKSKPKKINKILNDGTGIIVTGIHKVKNNSAVAEDEHGKNFSGTVQTQDGKAVQSKCNRISPVNDALSCERINPNNCLNDSNLSSTETTLLGDLNYKFHIESRKRRNNNWDHGDNLPHFCPTKAVTPKQVVSPEKPIRISKIDLVRCLPHNVGMTQPRIAPRIEVNEARDTINFEVNNLSKLTPCISRELTDFQITCCQEDKYKEMKPD